MSCPALSNNFVNKVLVSHQYASILIVFLVTGHCMHVLMTFCR